MDVLETDIEKLKRAIAEADAADQRRRREREAELQRISGMIAELVARHESYFWSPTHSSACLRAADKSEGGGVRIA